MIACSKSTLWDASAAQLINFRQQNTFFLFVSIHPFSFFLDSQSEWACRERRKQIICSKCIKGLIRVQEDSQQLTHSSQRNHTDRTRRMKMPWCTPAVMSPRYFFLLILLITPPDGLRNTVMLHTPAWECAHFASSPLKQLPKRFPISLLKRRKVTFEFSNVFTDKSVLWNATIWTRTVKAQGVF